MAKLKGSVSTGRESQKRFCGLCDLCDDPICTNCISALCRNTWPRPQPAKHSQSYKDHRTIKAEVSNVWELNEKQIPDQFGSSRIERVQNQPPPPRVPPHNTNAQSADSQHNGWTCWIGGITEDQAVVRQQENNFGEHVAEVQGPWRVPQGNAVYSTCFNIGNEKISL